MCIKYNFKANALIKLKKSRSGHYVLGPKKEGPDKTPEFTLGQCLDDYLFNKLFNYLEGHTITKITTNNKEVFIESN